MLESRRPIKSAILLMVAASLLGACAGDPQKAKLKYLAAGEKYMKQKQYGDAAVEFRNAIRLEPRSAESYYKLSQAASAAQDWQTAYTSLEKVIELDPARMDARVDRGRLYLAARQFDKAEQDANTVLQQDPKNAGGYEVLGGALVGQQKAEQALEPFTKVAELLPSDVNSYLNLALVEISLRRFKEAEEHLKQAVATDPKSTSANLDLANFYRLQNRVPEAQAALQAGIQNNPDAPVLYVDWASMLSEEGKSVEAEGVLASLRNQMPKSSEAAIAIGDYYIRKNDGQKALAEYRRGLSESVANLEIEKRIQELYLTSNQTEEATKLDGQLMSQAPKDPLVSVLHGRLLLALGKKQDAVIALQSTVKNSPNSSMAHYYLGLAHWQNENLGQANTELQEALKLSPGLPLILRSLVQLNLALNRSSQAQAYAQEMVQRNPADMNARLLLGSIYLREGQSRAAEEQFLVANLLAPGQASVHVNLGQLNAAERKWPQAEKEFESAIKIDPSNPVVVSAYADFLISRQDLPKAIALAQQFVEANPASAPGYMILGVVQFKAKNNVAARDAFERAININPRDVQGYLKLGAVYQNENQNDAAVAQYLKALDLQPSSAQLSTLVGNVYLTKEDLKNARLYYKRALDADPNFSVALTNTAWIDAVEEKDLDVALGMAQKASSQLPDVPSSTDVLAWVMYKRGNYSGAIPLLQDCVKKTPDSAQFHYHLGLALIADGQKVPGKAQLESALRIDKLRPAEKERAKETLSQIN
jgi:tetratricopeptide (TPR) repeat protein